LTDEATPEAARKAATIGKGRLHNKGLGLYKDHVTHTTSDDEQEEPFQGDVKRPLGDVTTVVKNENRKKDFGAQWEMQDDSPAQQKTTSNGNATGGVGPDRKKLLKGLDPHWGLYEDSPDKKEKANTERGYKTTGNGMGARKGAEAHWMMGDENAEFNAEYKTPAKPSTDTKNFWDF
jgi:hypothetical protein